MSKVIFATYGLDADQKAAVEARAAGMGADVRHGGSIEPPPPAFRRPRFDPQTDPRVHRLSAAAAAFGEAHNAWVRERTDAQASARDAAADGFREALEALSGRDWRPRIRSLLKATTARKVQSIATDAVRDAAGR